MAIEPKALLDDCLELEGLIALIIQRENRVPDHLYDLIDRKIESIKCDADSLRNGRKNPVTIADIPVADAEVAASVVFEEKSDADEMPPEVSDLPEPKEEPQEESASDTPLKNEPLYCPVTHRKADAPVCEVAEGAAGAPEDATDPVAQPENVEVVAEVVAVDEDETVKVESPDVTFGKTGVVINDILQPTTLSLNDRFRFRRELFDYSDEDMDEAIKIASAMSSAEEVQDYFYNDLCWDESDPNVVDFMRIITARFNK